MIEVRETVDLVLPDDLTEVEKERFNQDLNFIFEGAGKLTGDSPSNAFPHVLSSLLASKNKTVSTIYPNNVKIGEDGLVKSFINSGQGSLNDRGIYIFIPFIVDTLFLRSRDEFIGFIRRSYTEDGGSFLVNILSEFKTPLLEIMSELNFEGDVKDKDRVRRMCVTRAGISANVLPRIKRSLGVKPELFWPNFTQTPRELFEGFLKSDATVLILYGEPGLGKTQFIHELLDCMEKGKIHSNDNKDVFNHPEFIETLVKLKKDDIFITEDGMEMLRKREDGNSTMVGVLNATQGLNSSGSKFIISTNYTDLRDIDPALIRPGRTYRAIEFKKLTVEQANELRAAYERPVVDFGDKKSLTLAEALNWEDFIETESQRRSFGFNS